MKNNARLTALLLLAVMSVSAVSCASEAPAEVTEQTSAVIDDTTAAEASDGRSVSDDLPDIDLKGTKVSILVREEVFYEFAAEQTGDIIDDAIFERNQAVSERFNMVFDYVLKPGRWANKESYQGLISNAVMAGDSPYDIITGQSNIVIPLASQKMYIDLSDPTYIDYSKPYWKDGYHENAMINGKLYSVCGDNALTTLTMSNVLFFNTKLMDDYSIEYPYQSVKDGAWTLDKFIEMVNSVKEDLNGDSVMNQHDLRGFTGYNNSIAPFTYSCMATMTSVDSDGTRYIDFPDDKDSDVYDKIQALCISDSFYHVQNSEPEIVSELNEGRTLFGGMVLEEVERLRDMDTDFGIVPFPKYDEAQEEYVTSILRRLTVSSIPITATAPETSELILEAMACIGYNEIIPTYYDVALKDKYIRDAETAEMLDIVVETQYFDFMDVYYEDLGNTSDLLASYALFGGSSLASTFESRRNQLETQLENLYEAYED